MTLGSGGRAAAVRRIEQLLLPPVPIDVVTAERSGIFRTSLLQRLEKDENLLPFQVGHFTETPRYCPSLACMTPNGLFETQ